MSDYHTFPSPIVGVLMVGDVVRIKNVGIRRINYVYADGLAFRCGRNYYLPSDVVATYSDRPIPAVYR